MRSALLPQTQPWFHELLFSPPGDPTHFLSRRLILPGRRATQVGLIPKRNRQGLCENATPLGRIPYAADEHVLDHEHHKDCIQCCGSAQVLMLHLLHRCCTASRTFTAIRVFVRDQCPSSRWLPDVGPADGDGGS